MRYKTKQIKVGSLAIGGDAPISVQSMTFSKTKDINGTLAQINRLYFAGADLVRCAVLDHDDAKALAEIKKNSPLPIVADIHFNYRLALEVAPFVDAIRINPGNIGGKDRIKEVVKACKERNLPIRIGVNSGSLEEQFEAKFGRTPQGMIQSALYNCLCNFFFLNLGQFSLKNYCISAVINCLCNKIISINMSSLPCKKK